MRAPIASVLVLLLAGCDFFTLDDEQAGPRAIITPGLGHARDPAHFAADCGRAPPDRELAAG
jgi:hypothetical protein